MPRLRNHARVSELAPGLPVPYPALVGAGLIPRRGQTSLTVAGPGTGKSQLWANLAQRMRVPTLYWSADTDESDVLIRTFAMHTGFTIEQVTAWLVNDDYRNRLFQQLGNRSDHIEWVFDPRIEGPRIGERINAFAEIHGQYPHLVVVDNLRNATSGDEDRVWAEVNEIQQALQVLARETRAHIAALHHAKGKFEAGTTPIPLDGVLGNASKIPELVVTLHDPDGTRQRIGINIPKNRSGKSDPNAVSPIYLPIDYSRATVHGAKELVTA